MQYIQFTAVVCAAFLANLTGVAFARRVRDRRHLARGFSAGTVIAAAFFIFLPQALMRSGGTHGADRLLPLAGLGFVIALLLDRFGSRAWQGNAVHPTAIHAAAPKRFVHALLNGAAIGVAHHVSLGLSAAVSVALLVHEFSDSADAASSALGGSHTHPAQPSPTQPHPVQPHLAQPHPVRRETMLRAACLAAGLAATDFGAASPQALGVILALFGGYFAYLSASDLIPESYHEHPQLLTLVMTFSGAGVMYVLASLS